MALKAEVRLSHQTQCCALSPCQGSTAAPSCGARAVLAAGSVLLGWAGAQRDAC